MLVCLGMLLGGCGAAGPSATAPVPPPVLPDCRWGAQAVAWLDADEDGVRGDGELPLEGLRFVVADTVNGFPDVASGTSDAEGRARLVVSLPGCPRAAFVVAARPPPGYHLTTPDSREAVEGATVEFGAARDKGP